MKPYTSGIAPANHIHAKNYIHNSGQPIIRRPIVNIAGFQQATHKSRFSARFDYKSSVRFPPGCVPGTGPLRTLTRCVPGTGPLRTLTVAAPLCVPGTGPLRTLTAPAPLCSRYWAVTNINYIQSRNSRRVLTMIVLVWAFALAISVGPLFGWKDADFEDRWERPCDAFRSVKVSSSAQRDLMSLWLKLITEISIMYWCRYFKAASRASASCMKYEPMPYLPMPCNDRQWMHFNCS